MQPIRIYPQYTLILKYDIRPGAHERYFRYVTGEFLPTLQKRKIYMQNAWHVVYGEEQPERLIEFITEELETIRELLASPDWENLEQQLQTYTRNFRFRVVRYNGTFKL